MSVDQVPPARVVGRRAALSGIALATVCCVGRPRAQFPRPIRIKGPESTVDIRDEYFRDLLVQAFAATASDGLISLDIGQGATQSRAERALLAGALDVIWATVTVEREASLRAVPIPLEKGLLGKRVLLIRRKDAERFRTLDLAGLKDTVAGQGADWQSTRVLQANSFLVATSVNYETLFTNLRAGVIDHFPRGLNEAWAELQARDTPDLMVEETILLHYPATSYFWCRPDDEALANRIERGLTAMQADGRFDRFFFGHAAHHNLIARADLKHRRVFRLENPLLPASVPVADRRWWLDLGTVS